MRKKANQTGKPSLPGKDCEDYVEKRLKVLTPVFGKVVVGDFSSEVAVPDDEDDPFTELYMGVNILLEVVRGRMGELEQANKTLEKRVEDRAKAMYAIMKAYPDIVMLVDREGTIKYINRGFLDLSAEEVVGTSAFDYVAKKQRKVMRKHHKEAFNTGNAVTFEIKREEGKGTAEAWYQSRVVPISDVKGAEKELLLSINQDITKQKQAEQMLKHKTRELERSNEELQNFAYHVSHDLQEPLQMISIYIELLGDRYATHLDETGKKFVRFAVDGSKRMQRMMKALLQYSRAGTGKMKMEAFDLNALLDEVKSVLQFPIEEAGGKLKYDNLPEVRGHKALLLQVFQNLVSNALKFRDPNDRPAIRIKAEDTEHEWVLAVQDNGIGIEEQYQKRIFIMFQRLHTDKEYEGTGLGLALCRKIVERHGGRIWLKSKPGEGSTFFFTLPKGMHRTS